MHIFDFFGAHQTDDLAEFKKIIKERDGKLNANYLEIMNDPKNIYPYIAIFIRDSHAAAYFFEKEGQPPLSSRAAAPSLATDDVLFYENPEGGGIFISFVSVIAAVDAEMAAVEFFRLKSKPSCINWDIF